MSEGSASQREEDQQLDEKLDEFLGDPEKRAAILRKLGVASPTSSFSGGSCTPVGDSGKKDSQSEHPTLSGESMGECRGPPAPLGGQPLWWPQGGFPPFPPGVFAPVPGAQAAPPMPHWPHPYGQGPVPTAPVPAAPNPRKRPAPVAVEDVSDVSACEDGIELLGEAEALELVEFDPSVEPEDSWEPPSWVIEAFLDKHFNRSLSEAERKAILKDFPKPQDVQWGHTATGSAHPGPVG